MKNKNLTIGLIGVIFTTISLPSVSVELEEEVRRLRQRVSQLRIDMQRSELRNLEAVQQLSEIVNKINSQNNDTPAVSNDQMRAIQKTLTEQQNQILQLNTKLNQIIKTQNQLTNNTDTIDAIQQTTATIPATNQENSSNGSSTRTQTNRQTTKTIIVTTETTNTNKLLETLTDKQSTPSNTNQPDSQEALQNNELYNKSFELLVNSQFVEAEQSFIKFITENPTSPLVPSALYWLGEAYYVQSKFEEALLSYNKVIVNFPNNKKYGESLLKSGFTLMELERYSEARLALKKVQSDFPGQNIAHLATRKLELIKIIE